MSGTVGTAKATINYTTYGVLYNWPAALTACPSGWHLPSDAEWTVLTDYLTNNGFGYEGSGSDIAKSLAAKSDWDYSFTPGAVGNDRSGNNRSGFAAHPGGYHYGEGAFEGIGGYTGFWSASEMGMSSWYRSMEASMAEVGASFNNPSLGFSVRCLLD